MLTDLAVEGLGVIERASLTFDRGCNALTGETGAGKTLVVAALSLLLGARADRTLIRDGAPEALVEGRFVVPPEHPAATALATAGLAAPGDADVEIVMSRSIAAGGSGKARINGRLVTLATLGEVASHLIEIAGQHEHHRLALSGAQRVLLDSFAGDEALSLAREVEAAVRSAARLRRDLARARERSSDLARKRELLESEVREISTAGITPGELAELEVLTRRAENAESISEALARAADALDREQGAIDLVTSATKDVEAAATDDGRLADIAARLRSASVELADVVGDIKSSVAPPDAAELEQMRARMALLARLRRRYGATEREILDHLGRAESALVALDGAEEELQKIAREIEAAELRANAAAERLSSLRRDAAPALEAAISRRLAGLALPDARIRFELEAVEMHEGGLESVAMLVSTNAGEPPKPVSKVASGGELSRLALAVRLVSAGEGRPTMVFDEIDAALGGRAARAVGQALADLSTRSATQVITITHLPQVAAFADAHHVVEKVSDAGRVRTRVERVEGERRVEELSRMLAGLPESIRAREHALELLETSGEPA